MTSGMSGSLMRCPPKCREGCAEAESSHASAGRGLAPPRIRAVIPNDLRRVPERGFCQAPRRLASSGDVPGTLRPPVRRRGRRAFGAATPAVASGSA